MPTFTAIAFDRLIEPRESKSVDMPVPNSKPALKPKPVPKPHSRLERRNSTSVVSDRKANRPQMTPALYATPEATPLPDSPTSFPPSPYIINHKRRGPRLVKSFSQADVASRQKLLDGGKTNGDATEKEELNSVNLTTHVPVNVTELNEVEHMRGVSSNPVVQEQVSWSQGAVEIDHVKSVKNGELGNNNGEFGSSKKEPKNSNKDNSSSQKCEVLKLAANSERDSECEDFYDPQESMSYASNTDVEDNAGPESSVKLVTPKGEFYDAWEELSSENGPQNSLSDLEAEMREIRLSLLMEIEKRKQAEESLNDMRSQWQRIRQHLAHVGLTLPESPNITSDGEQTDVGPAEDICRQVFLARFVSESVGRGIAKAEAEAEMEAQIESKNFEIARLLDRLHYYEAMNREMSQRNQEAVEMARRERLRRKRRQRWVWGSIAAAITLGTAALAWSYIPAGKESPSTSDPHVPEHDDASKR